MPGETQTLVGTGLIGVALGALGAVVAGFLKYKSDIKKLTVDERKDLSDVQSRLIASLMDRIKHLEEGRAKDRRIYEAHIESVRLSYRKELKQSREEYAKRISELEEQVNKLRGALGDK